MKIASRKDIIWLSIILLALLSAGYEREVIIHEDEILYCGRNTTIFPSPKNIPYDVVFYSQACGMEGATYTEIRLKSKSPPHEQKSVFRYEPRKDEDDAARVPKIRWVSPHQLEIGLNYVETIEYRYDKVRDIDIHYKMKTAWPEGLNGAMSAGLWERLGLGWSVMADEPNVVYVDKPVK